MVNHCNPLNLLDPNWIGLVWKLKGSANKNSYYD